MYESQDLFKLTTMILNQVALLIFGLSTTVISFHENPLRLSFIYLHKNSPFQQEFLDGKILNMFWSAKIGVKKKEEYNLQKRRFDFPG